MLTDAQRLAAILALLRARVASGDLRASVLSEVEEVAGERDQSPSESSQRSA